ncbi:transposable element Tcb1 transposase [Trichonephila clavipes]|uniref:Transposable element Tcb1 transposase n=1 Tax=Trichonephila clavipes TaxID=2585209 RepID=A0A8X6SV38_TRICX|nr:transposable element Tcb1 transposase [Trichonephila clavipes]
MQPGLLLLEYRVGRSLQKGQNKRHHNLCGRRYLLPAVNMYQEHPVIQHYAIPNQGSWLEIYANFQSSKTSKSNSDKVPYRFGTPCALPLLSLVVTLRTYHFYDLTPTVPSQSEIGSHVERNQTTVIRIGYRWMQEGTTDRCGALHPPQCTTSREDRQFMRMAVTDRSVKSRTVAQHIESVSHHSVSARTIRRRLQQSGLSARRPLLGLPLTQNHRRLRRQ